MLKIYPFLKIFYFGLSSFLAYNCEIIFSHFYKVSSDTLLIFLIFFFKIVFVMLVTCQFLSLSVALLGLCDLSSWTRDRTWALAVKGPSPNHWTTTNPKTASLKRPAYKDGPWLTLGNSAFGRLLSISY